MFRQILIATDASEISDKAVTHGLKLAQALGASVTALTVTTPWKAIAVGEVATVVPEEPYEREAAKVAKERLDKVGAAARDAGVTCDRVHRASVHVWEAILDVAKNKNCDLIVMGGHGRRGLDGFLIGSETQKVLTHGKVPVLVYRG